MMIAARSIRAENLDTANIARHHGIQQTVDVLRHEIVEFNE